MSDRIEYPPLLHHPLAINSFRHWLNLVRTSGGVDRKYIWRALFTTFVSPLFSLARLRDRVYAKKIEAQEIKEPPIFIIGHWRTGTTHLHNLMTQDPGLAFISVFQAMAPGSYLAKPSILPPILHRAMPDKRPMDNMDLSLSLPQEEEFAVCHLSPYSMYLGWYFPRRCKELFSKYVLFQGVTEHEIEEWKKNYMGIIKKASFHSGGKRLVLKNPVNTGRVKMLAELFPGAKFVHIYRDPYVVFKSTQKLHRSMINHVTLQEFSCAEIEENVLFFYREIMNRYFVEKELIPDGSLTEVKFEDLEKQPMVELERIYVDLGLPGWEDVCAPMDSYLAKQKNYRKNVFSITDSDIAKVEANWMFAINRWGYRRPMREPPKPPPSLVLPTLGA
jgi:omega-hydroxy-beta-dihydromenaquinone-9 sulfotransferase